MFNHILLAIDLDHISEKAVEMATSFQKENPSTKITVVHVDNGQSTTEGRLDSGYLGANQTPIVDPGIHGQGVLPPLSAATPNDEIRTDSYKNEIREREKDVFSGIRDQFLSRGLHANFEIVGKDPSIAERIASYAEEANADLILVGNTHLQGIKKLFLGSHSEKIAQHAKTSVLIVK
ncbi:universal stress protein [Bacillus coahuilensis]|uniref:universal stress protein n=1 Tax=Bacillus coahuilensis TaxID=408580 RepID=UPI0007513C0C|nr:universal stress protein [Bacillus coahuilensis]